MGYYAAIAKVAGLTGSSLTVDERLKKAAGLIVKIFPFEQCALYLWDEDSGLFSLKALAGIKKGGEASYKGGEGIPGIAKKKKTIIEAHVRIGDTRWKKNEDRGLEGFKSAAIVPIMKGDFFYGVIYLKSSKKTVLGTQAKGALNCISSQLVNILKYRELERSLDGACAELGDLKKRLHDSEKFMALGDMAAALAHDIKNPLLSIGGFAGKLKTILTQDSPALPFVENMVREIGKLESIINGMLGVLKGSPLKPEMRDINLVIEDVLSDFMDEFRAHGIKVIRNLFRGQLYAMAEGSLLRIAFDNLISNAIQSMEKGGILRVGTSLNREWVSINITDTGGGINPEYLDRIFDPFFTTRKGGTGLGLPITHSIVTRHGGTVSVVNNPGGGATFTVRLPVAQLNP